MTEFEKVFILILILLPPCLAAVWSAYFDRNDLNQWIFLWVGTILAVWTFPFDQK